MRDRSIITQTSPQHRMNFYHVSLSLQETVLEKTVHVNLYHTIHPKTLSTYSLLKVDSESCLRTIIDFFPIVSHLHPFLSRVHKQNWISLPNISSRDIESFLLLYEMKFKYSILWVSQYIFFQLMHVLYVHLMRHN
jgi:hypothetical protein